MLTYHVGMKLFIPLVYTFIFDISFQLSGFSPNLFQFNCLCVLVKRLISKNKPIFYSATASDCSVGVSVSDSSFRIGGCESLFSALDCVAPFESADLL